MIFGTNIIFISILFCEMIGFLSIFLYFGKLNIFPAFNRCMILMNHRTAKCIIQTNLNFIQIWPGLGEAVCAHPQACRGFFSNSVLRKLKIFMLAFFDLYRNLYHLFSINLIRIYWLFVVKKFSVVHLFIQFNSNLLHLILTVFWLSCKQLINYSIAIRVRKQEKYQ